VRLLAMTRGAFDAFLQQSRPASKQIGKAAEGRICMHAMILHRRVRHEQDVDDLLIRVAFRHKLDDLTFERCQSLDAHVMLLVHGDPLFSQQHCLN
jgi:hypothetical protein